MKVYLDNNIIVDIEDGIIKLEPSTAKEDIIYYFSETHIEELLNGLVAHPELKEIRLHTLELLCGTNYIAQDVGPFKGGLVRESPQRVFELSMQFKRLHDQLYQYTNAMRINREAFLEELHLERLKIGNYKPSAILNVLDNKLRKHLGYGIDVYLQKSVATTGRSVFSSLFNLLDFVCYWHDKNHAARLYDSSHAYFAQYCDVIVSNDKRMRIKTEAVYSYLGIKTQVFSADDYLVYISTS